MRILIVANRLPYQGIAGGYSIVLHRIIELARRGHEVGLVAFERDVLPGHIEALRPYLFELELVPPPPPRSSLKRVMDYLFAAEPSRFRDCRSNEMKKRIGDMVERSHYDVVQAEFVRMGQHIYRNPWLPAVRRVLSCHRSLALMTRNEIACLGCRPLSWLQSLRVRGMEAYELNLYHSMDHILVLTASERLRTLSMSPQARVTVVPSGVDPDYFTADFTRPREESVLFTGNFKDRANEDAACWFARTVWPILRGRWPNLTFEVVGPQATAAMKKIAAGDERIRLHGKAVDLRPHLYRARVFVCPVRMGAGLRTKVLEAMAAGLPVVSTVLGVEGIPAQIGENCFLADQPGLMAEYIGQLLRDPALAGTIARHARRMIEERFTWEAGTARLEQTLRRITSRSI